jgi:esterase/lipase
MNLATTNLFLGILAAVSVIELIGLAVGGLFAYRLYTRATELLQGVEERQVAPAMARVNAILDDVKGVTTKVQEETDKVDQAIRGTLGRVDETADRVRATVQARANRALGFVHGVRVAIETFLSGRSERRRPQAPA